MPSHQHHALSRPFLLHETRFHFKNHCVDGERRPITLFSLMRLVSGVVFLIAHRSQPFNLKMFWGPNVAASLKEMLPPKSSFQQFKYMLCVFFFFLPRTVAVRSARHIHNTAVTAAAANFMPFSRSLYYQEQPTGSRRVAQTMSQLARSCRTHRSSGQLGAPQDNRRADVRRK